MDLPSARGSSWATVSAVQYNKSRGYDTAVVQRIQRTVGVEADGKWGRRTVAKIKDWQRSRGVAADGKVGPGTLAQFEALWAKDAEPEGDEDLDDRGDDEALPEAEVDDDDAPPARATVEVGEDESAYAYFDADVDIKEGDRGAHVYALQNDLFAFGFEPGRPDGKLGRGGLRALQGFQIAAATPDRLRGYARVKVPVTYTGGSTRVVDAATRAEIRRWKEQGLRWQDPSSDFAERRVKVKDYAPMPRSSALLVDIPAVRAGKTKRLHKLAAEALAAMSKAAEEAGHPALGIQSAWRAHRWKSRKHYEEQMVKRYGSVQKGRRYVAYNSPHETGLAIDIGVGGLEAKSKTIPQQRETALYKWLVVNAFRFGWRPYKREPWHWEFPISLRAWETGLSDWRLSDD